MMKKIRIYCCILGAMFFGFFRASAQEEGHFATATSALQDVLGNLKESVDKLSMDNNQLEAKDKYIDNQILQMQMQLGALETQGDQLDRSAAALQEDNPHLAQKITQLEDENFDLDGRIQKSENAIKLVEQSLDADYREDQKLLFKLKDMASTLPVLPVVDPREAQAAANRQKEKLRLMKMIYDSQQRQESLHESIMEFQKTTAVLPAAGAMAHQELLKQQIKDLESQIASYPPAKISGNSTDQWDDSQERQLEAQLKALEKNYSQLKNLMDQMGQKTQPVPMTVGQRVEEVKLQDSVKDLNRQGVSLRAQLDDLRTQMIDLDKRKTHLDTMIQQLPN